MAYRNKVFVSFDGDKDIHYYRLMRAWTQSDRTPFNFNDAHELNYARDSSLEASIKSQLSERLRKSNIFVSLVGESTRYLTKFVKWEIDQAITRELPIIVVNLDNKRQMDDNRCPSALKEALAIHVSFNAKILQHALEHWPEQNQSLNRQGMRGPYYYNESIYRQLGL